MTCYCAVPCCCSTCHCVPCCCSRACPCPAFAVSCSLPREVEAPAWTLDEAAKPTHPRVLRASAVQDLGVLPVQHLGVPRVQHLLPVCFGTSELLWSLRLATRARRKSRSTKPGMSISRDSKSGSHVRTHHRLLIAVIFRSLLADQIVSLEKPLAKEVLRVPGPSRGLCVFLG